MRSVTYHPIGDPHHCIYRMMCLLGAAPEKTYFVDKFKIMDFFALFPSLLPKISRPRNLITKMSQMEKEIFEEPYQLMPHRRSLFNQLSEIHRASISHLLGKGIVSLNAFNAGRISLSEKVDVLKLAEDFYQGSSLDASLLALLTTELGDMELLGPKGIKARTGLLEYRYDDL